MTKKKAVVATMDFTPASARAWLLPPFQRPLMVNAKVQALAMTIKADGGVVPGMLTFGVFEGKVYLIDGQHRREAFLLSGCLEGLVDTRTHHFDSMADMGAEFVNLNSRLVVMRPDDVLRGVEGTVPALGRIRTELPYVGYNMIRRGEKSPIVSMSGLLRCWRAAGQESPVSGGSALEIARTISDNDVGELVRFMRAAMSAWGRDQEYSRLWNTLNVTLCMWLFRRIVAGNSLAYAYTHVQSVTPDQWKQCLMALSADPNYCEWLTGRNLTERDRNPCFGRIKVIFAARLRTEKGKTRKLPQPVWASTLTNFKR